MLYLLKSYIKGNNNFIYKIGFSDNFKNRFSHYFYLNPGIECIGTRDGDEILEKLLHFYLYSLGLKYKKGGKLEEWFIPDPRVLQIFHISKISLERKIWKRRDIVFDPIKVKKSGTLDNTLFRYLYDKNKDTFCGEEFSFNKETNVVVRLKTLKTDLSFMKFLRRTGNIEIPEDLGDYKDEIEKEVDEFLEKIFYSTGIFEKKMRMYCEFMDKHREHNQEFSDLIYFKIKDERFRRYYNYFGTSGCSALKYQEGNLRDGMKDTSLEFEIKSGIRNKFKTGQVYTKKEIKLILSDLYRDLGVSKTPKASDLENYFELSRGRITNPETKKREEGFRIGEIK